MCFHFRGQCNVCCVGSIHLGGMTMDRNRRLPDEYHQVVWRRIVASVLTMILRGTTKKKDFIVHTKRLGEMEYIIHLNICSLQIQTGPDLGVQMLYKFRLWIFVLKFKLDERGARWNIYQLWVGPEAEEQDPWVWHIRIVIVRLRDFICQKVSSFEYFKNKNAKQINILNITHGQCPLDMLIW